MALEQLLKNESLINYLKTKEPKQEYNYYNTPVCGLSEYFQSNGFPEIRVGGHYIFRAVNGYYTKIGELPEGWNDAVAGWDFHGVTQGGALTYGAWLSRMEELNDFVH